MPKMSWSSATTWTLYNSLRLCWILSPKKCRSMPTSKMTNHAKSGWKILLKFLQVSIIVFAFPDSFHSLKNTKNPAWAMQFSKNKKLKSCTFRTYLKKTFHFLKFAISDFQENNGFKKTMVSRKQWFQEKNKRKCPTASKKWKWIHSLHAELQNGTFYIILYEVKMRTRLRGFS